MRSKLPLRVCRQILKQSGSSFATAFQVLPREQRDAMTAFYAFCRHVDDEVDDAQSLTDACKSVEEWKKKIDSIYTAQPEDPVCQALGWMVARFGVRREHLELILAGVEQDLTVTRYESFSDLYEYAYRVASAVGLVCITILGESSAEVELYAELSGIAVQLTNILRDVGEDADGGRIYLPLEDLRAFGVTEQDLTARRMTRSLKRVLRFEACRARQYYDLAGAALPPHLRHKLFFTETLRETYARLLETLVQEDFPVFRTRISLASRDKLIIALKRRMHPATLWRARTP